MRRLIPFLLLFFLLLPACQVEEETPGGSSVPRMFPALTEFHFSGEALGEGGTAECSLSTETITLDLKGLEPGVELIPHAEGRFKLMKINDIAVGEGKAIALERENDVTLFGYNSSQKRSYRLIVHFYESIPKVTIKTEAEIADKFNFVNASFTFSDFPGEETIETTGGIHGRGNSTWYSYPKKPYRIKLDESAGIFGMKKDKDWVLLAEYCDKSLMRATYLNTVSKTVGLPWTPESIHVSLYLNGEYEGVYLFTEAIEEGKNKVDIDVDGFLIENDNYWSQENPNLTTDHGIHFSFKYPGDGEISYNDDNYNYIRDFMNAMENGLFNESFDDPVRGYRAYLDIDSFARWFIVQEILGNLDTNPYMALSTRGGKLKFYPVWDAEWSMGLASPGANGWQTYPEKPNYNEYTEIWSNNTYFAKLFEDPNFVEYVYNVWQLTKNELDDIREAISKEAETIKDAQIDNFTRWQILGQPVSVGLYFFDTWEEEVDYIAGWFDRRTEWFDSFITSRYHSAGF